VSVPERMPRSPRAFAWYPLLFVASVVLRQFVVVDVSPFAMFRPLVLALACVAVVEILLGLLLRDWDRGGLATVVVLFGVLGWGDGRVLVLLALLTAVLVLLERLPRRHVSTPAITSWLNVFTSVLLLLVLAGGVLSGRVAEAAADLVPSAGVQQAVARTSAPDPDIYVIIMDGYARPDNLRTRFGFDDTPFLESLASRGFDTSSSSRSNYAGTALTLISMLGMAYLEDIPEVARTIAAASPSEDAQGSGLFRAAINNNRLFSELRARGSEIVSVGSGVEPVAVRHADVYLDAGGLNSFELSLLDWAPGLAAIAQTIAPDLAGEQARARLTTSLDFLHAISEATAAGPRLVFVHLMAPHPPAVFGPNGEPVPYYDDASPDYPAAKERYVGQVAYLNKRVEAVVADMVDSSPSSVIVLMSDHGSKYGSDDHPWVWDIESVENFFSARTPGHPGLFGDSPTPVNLFPTLFNAYLGMDLPLEANRSFLSANDAPLRLSEVSP
jgi:hypothetical protein